MNDTQAGVMLFCPSCESDYRIVRGRQFIAMTADWMEGDSMKVVHAVCPACIRKREKTRWTVSELRVELIPLWDNYHAHQLDHAHHAVKTFLQNLFAHLSDEQIKLVRETREREDTL